MKERMLGMFILPVLILYAGGGTYADTAAYIYDSLNRLVRADYGDGAYAEYSYDDAGNMTRRVFQEGQPFMVKLAEFRAEMSGGCVLLTWKTLSETDTAGFHILRSGSENGEYGRITAVMTAAEGEATHGAVYSYTDCDVNPAEYIITDLRILISAAYPAGVKRSPRQETRRPPEPPPPPDCVM